MDALKVLLERSSTRGFLKKPVDKKTLETILTASSRAVSFKNYQPWTFHVVAGEALERVRRRYAEAFRAKKPVESPEISLKGEFLDRAREVGIQMFQAMDIKREDKDKRADWYELGYRFFDAPVLVLLTMPADIDTRYFFDVGCAAENLVIAAAALGLGSVVQEQAVAWPSILREELGVPEEEQFVYGVSLGWPDPDFPANKIVTSRRDLEESARWHGIE